MNELIVVRGGGDIATGTIHRLVRCGYKVIVTEVENPSAIRRKVAFCEAVFDKCLHCFRLERRAFLSDDLQRI